MPTRFAQYGTKHGHAAGKARSIQTNDEAELVGIYEPDLEARAAASRQSVFADVRWFRSPEEMLSDPSIAAIAVEGLNEESLAMAHEALVAGKHLWYDKPAGDDWLSFQRLVAEARTRSLRVQMGYMLRYHGGFRQIADWARSGFLGDVFSVRAHMSTWLTVPARDVIGHHTGGIFYDLAGHMLDQVVWLLGRPHSVRTFLRNDHTADVPSFEDNTLGVFEFDRALAFVDIAAIETRPMARRFEVYGTTGSAIMEPFEPSPKLWLTLDEARGGFAAGRQEIHVDEQPRQLQYDRELVALLAVLRGEQEPDRTLDHELLVQETLLRSVGKIAEGATANA